MRHETARTTIVSLLTCATFFACGTAWAGPKLAEAPAAIRPYLPPPSPYTLDAGTCQVLPIGQDGVARTTVDLTVTASAGGKPPPAKVHWSAAKGPEGAPAELTGADASHCTIVFHQPGEYFLRADVKVGDWSDWQSVVIQVFSPAETGFAMDHFPPPPKPGVHPRVLINPQDVPVIRQRLANTVIGREMAKKLQINSQLLRHGAAGFDAHGPLSKLFDGTPSVDNVGYFASTSTTYRKLVAGDTNALGAEIAGMSGDTSRLAEQMTAEALWCLLSDDKQGARDVAAAITTWAKIVTPTIKADDDWQWTDQSFGLLTYGKQQMGRLFDKVGRENIGLCYDFIYDQMTPEQRGIVRQMISRATTGKVGYGMDLPHYARVGNWVTFHTAALMILSLSIEGEEGYDPSIYRSGAETFRDYYQYSILQDGESFESIGKGGAAPLIVVPMAKRGDWVAAHPHLRNYYREYLLNCLEPYGYHYIALSTLGDSNLTGGLHLDACVAKQCYPDDPVVEKVYHNVLGEQYGGSFKVTDLLPLTLWGQDYAVPPGQPWQWDKSQPLTYVGRDQGLVVTRSDWSKESLYLFFDSGSNIRDMGHYDPARNLLIVSALGRNWLADTGKEESAEAHSVILIDGKGGSKCFGRLASINDQPEFTSLCGDATYAYNWAWTRSMSIKNGQVDPTTVNGIRFAPLPERWAQTPLTYLYSFFSPFRLVRLPWISTDHAYRDAALRRGPHPYILVADDIQKDAQSHRYEFLLRLPDDLVNHMAVDDNEVTLSDPASDARFLIRVLNPAKVEIETRRIELRKDRLYKTILSIATDAVSPDFRVLLYPYHQGESIPASHWDDAKHEIRIETATPDVWQIAKATDGHPSLALER